MRIRKLNVRAAQLEQCVKHSMFARPTLRNGPPPERGDILLLQLVKRDVRDPHARIRFALVLDRIHEDVNNESDRIWGRHWRYVLKAQATIPTIPFSLEDIPGLQGGYVRQGDMSQLGLILEVDEPLIRPYLQGSIDLPGKVPALELGRTFGTPRTLAAIRNRDQILRWNGALPRDLSPSAREEHAQYVAGRALHVPAHDEYYRDPWLAEALKSYYCCRCQVCGHDFRPRYGQPFAETHHIQALHEGGEDVSANVVVICPNHHRIIEATGATSSRTKLQFTYPNGLVEPLKSSGHLIVETA